MTTTPDLAAILRALARWKVRYVLTGSLAAAAHGAPFRVRDVDVTPALDVDNLHRIGNLLEDLGAVPRFHEKGPLTRAACRAWTVEPVSDWNLDHLFETTHGQLDIVPRLCGDYADLRRRAVPMVAFDEPVQVAAVEDILAGYHAKSRTKNRARDAAYGELEERWRRKEIGAAADGDGRHFCRVASSPSALLLEEEDRKAAEGSCTASARGGGGLVPIEAVVSEEGYHHRLIRCRLGESRVLVKKANSEANRIFTEWAGYELLARLPDAAPLVPHFFGGDRATRLLCLEDLGDVRETDLATLLAGHDREAAERLLVGTMRATGTIQAATFGRGAEYEGIRATFPAAEGTHAADRLDRALAGLQALLLPPGSSPPPAILSECEEARQTLAHPAFLTYTRGDACTKNAVASPGGVKLFDLEWGGYRHALVDGAFPAIRHLHCLYARGIPAGVRDEMEGAYRTALARGCRAARDDARWADALAAASAGWLAEMMSRLPRALEEDARRGSATLRQRIVASLESFADVSRRTARLPTLGTAAEEAGHRLRAHWKSPALPLHAVFLYRAAR